MKLEEIELNLLISAIQQQYGHDLNSYAIPSLQRRVKNALSGLHLKHISDLIPFILHDYANYTRLLNELSITVTGMFRDAEVFLTLRNDVLPTMNSQPYIKIWHAGCATGEEVYSLAIILHEKNILDKCIIFATDINQQAIDIARQGIYNKDYILNFSNSYQDAGGEKSLNDYFVFSRFSTIRVKPFIKEKIVFARHDLTFEEEFSEVHLVLCRNVLMYFSDVCQKKIIAMFKQSLYPGGYLCIGQREMIEDDSELKAFAAQKRIFNYQKNNREDEGNTRLTDFSIS